MLPLLLASSSAYRRELLARLQLPFTCSSPDIDESHRPGESAIELVKRLAEEKARALADSHTAHLIIGSDQVAVLGERIIGKPHTFEKAREQLLAASGASVTFLTGLALLNSQTGRLPGRLRAVYRTHAHTRSAPASNATCAPNNPTTALAASRPKAWGSACFTAPKALTPPA